MLLKECNIVSQAFREVALFPSLAQNCSCDYTCRTRVAQKPRRYPLEVFKTPDCGWGVRPAVRIPKGALIGLYSGSVAVSLSFLMLPADTWAFPECCCVYLLLVFLYIVIHPSSLQLQEEVGS